MRNPFAWITIFFCVGIIGASQARIPFFPAWAISMCCCILCAALLLKGEGASPVSASLIAALCGLVFCGAACLVNADTQPPDHISRALMKAMADQCIVSGRIASEPFIKCSRTTFALNADTLTAGRYSYGCSGDLRVIVNEAVPFEYGTAVEITGRIGSIPAFGSRRGHGAGESSGSRRGCVVLRVPSAHCVRILSDNEPPGIVARCLRIKRKSQNVIRAFMPPVAAAIMEAMLLGDKSHIPRPVYNDMIKSGTVHILVVSGFNVGVVAGAAALVLKVMRFNRLIRLAVIIPLLALYCIMTGASPPVVRATIMGIFLFLSWYVRRDPSIQQALSLSAFCILACAPRQLYNASFQLSFAAVAAISVLSPLMTKLFRVDSVPSRPVRWIAGLAVVSMSAWLGTGGLTAYYFRIISPVTVLANIFIPVLASLITLCGAALIMSSFLCPYFANSFASVSEFLILSLLRLNGFLIAMPGAYWKLP